MVEVLYRHEHIIGKTSQKSKKKKKKKKEKHFCILMNNSIFEKTIRDMRQRHETRDNMTKERIRWCQILTYHTTE